MECDLNQDCTCHDVTIDQQDIQNSDDNKVYLRVQECDGSWNTRTFAGAGSFIICIMNLWSVSGGTSWDMYILVGGNITLVTFSTVTDLGTGCTNDFDC
jgi:hypothetical protein